jgi:hypothetical protein
MQSPQRLVADLFQLDEQAHHVKKRALWFGDSIDDDTFSGGEVM